MQKVDIHLISRSGVDDVLHFEWVRSTTYWHYNRHNRHLDANRLARNTSEPG